MWRGQLNPEFRGSPGATQQAPPCLGREGARDKREDFPVSWPHPSPTPFQDRPSHWASGGSNCPAPSRGQHRAI